jgi:hypothetical protein
MAARMEMALEANGSGRDEIVWLEAQEYKVRQEQLLVLVGELLRTNEELRQKLAGLEAQGQPQGNAGESIQFPD